jgi:hypothetical protein
MTTRNGNAVTQHDVTELDREIMRQQDLLAGYRTKLAERGPMYTGGYKALVARTSNIVAKLECQRAKLEETSTESEMDRRQLMLEEETAAANTPRDGRVPVADKRIDAGGWIFNRGCRIPSLDMLAGPGYYAAMKHVRWDLPSEVNERIKPIRMVAPTPVLKPVVILKEDWPRSVRATAAQPGCNPALAQDLLIVTREGARQHDHWARVEAERHSRENNLPGRRIMPTLTGG